MEIFVALAEEGRRLLSRASDVFELLSTKIYDAPLFRELNIHLLFNDLFGLPLDASLLSMVTLSWIYGIVGLNLVKWITSLVNIF